jgi:hypothetical protein
MLYVSVHFIIIIIFRPASASVSLTNDENPRRLSRFLKKNSDCKKDGKEATGA